uniref:Uncharacterized protein n=1 Tax=Trichogramma kaykai TaxID=54128 RepID=A0ABD2WJ90_9HYME
MLQITAHLFAHVHFSEMVSLEDSHNMCDSYFSHIITEICVLIMADRGGEIDRIGIERRRRTAAAMVTAATSAAIIKRAVDLSSSSAEAAVPTRRVSRGTISDDGRWRRRAG